MRFRNLIAPIIALAGVAIAASAVLTVEQKPKASTPLAQPAAAPFAGYIGGTGQIEPLGKTIGIASPMSGVVADVRVSVGNAVKDGDILFRLDNRVELAERAEKAADVAAAQAQIDEAEANLGDYRAQLKLAEAVTDRRAISAEDLTKRRFAVRVYEAKLMSARAQLASTQAQLATIDQQLAQLIVRAPFDGVVLEVNVRVGEYASAAALSTPLIMFRRAGKFAVRVQIDQDDAWRFRPSAAGMMFLRGNRDLRSSLSYAYTEPYIVPKTSLTGDSTERVDTRVLEAVYTIDDPKLPIYLGQVVDVFIEAPSLSISAHEPKTSELR